MTKIVFLDIINASGGDSMKTAKEVESFLNKRPVKAFLRYLSKKDKNGKSLIYNVFDSYVDPHFPVGKKILYAPFYLFVLFMRKKLNLSKEDFREKIVDMRPTVIAVNNLARSVGHWGVTRPQNFYSPLLIVWNFTNGCNLKCKHCYQNAGTPWPDELTLQEKLKAVDQMAEEDVPTLAISGGEPYTSKDLFKVTRYAHDKGMHVSIATNGTFLSLPRLAEKTKEAGVNYVEISLDSVNPEVHDEFRGVKGAWEMTVKGIRNAVKVKGLQVGIATTATKYNVQEVEDLYKFSVDIGADKFFIFNFIPVGRGKEIIDMDPTPEDREKIMGILYKHLTEGKIDVFSTAPEFGMYCIRENPLGPVVTSHYSASSGKFARDGAEFIGGCGAGRAYFALQPNGDVTPCVFMPTLVVGNIRKTPLGKIWRDSKVLQDLRNRDKLEENCKSCEFRAVCGGCRARAYAYYGDYLAPDPGCIYNKDYWDKLVESSKKEFAVHH